MALKRGLTLHVLLAILFPLVGFWFILIRIKKTGLDYCDRFQPLFFLKLGNGLFWGVVVLVLASFFLFAMFAPTDTKPMKLDTMITMLIMFIIPWIASGIGLIVYSRKKKNIDVKVETLRRTINTTLIRDLNLLAGQVGIQRPALDNLLTEMIHSDQLNYRLDPIANELISLDSTEVQLQANLGRRETTWKCPICSGANTTMLAPEEHRVCAWCGKGSKPDGTPD